jgi:hypothetical protein
MKRSPSERYRARAAAPPPWHLYRFVDDAALVTAFAEPTAPRGGV